MTASPSILHRNAEERRLLRLAFATSVGVHILAFSLWLLLATLVVSLNQSLIAQLRTAELEARKRAQDEPPLVYVDVTPEQATPQPPDTAKFYSAASSQAANPEPDKETGVPKIDGSQENVPKTFDTLHPSPEPLPAPPEPPPEPDPAPPSQPPDLAVGEPKPRPRPRSVMEARLQQGLVGPRMRQEGGVARRGVVSLDVKASPFGSYDSALIAAIQQRWYTLLDGSSVPMQSGRAVIEFTLHHDGRITDLKVAEQDVGEILALYCRKAVSDPAPYPAWPKMLRDIVSKDYRDIRITFYYH